MTPAPITTAWAIKAPDPAKVLDLLKKKIEWGMAVDRNHLFSYDQFGEMIAEAEKRVQVQEMSEG